MSGRRFIIHVDMDAFFASVEQMDDPSLKGKPVIVGGDPYGRGVVSAASYEARKYGVHSAMPMKQARKLCPEGVYLPVRMKRYSELSGRIHQILSEYSPLVEHISIDEAVLDVTESLALFGSGERIGKDIKKRIRSETGLTASVGIAANKFLAKLASDLEKPDGFLIISEADKQRILDPLPVSKIYGVGKVTAKNLKKAGIETISQLRQTRLEVLRETVGNFAVNLHNLACGIDNSPVVPEREVKSISSEMTFEKDVGDKDMLQQVLVRQIEEVGQRLRESSYFAKVVHLKLRYGNFKTISRSKTFTEPTDITGDLLEAGRAVFDKWFKEEGGPLRLIGFGVSGLSEAKGRQESLFADPEKDKQKRLDRVVDEIKGKFGPDSLKRGH